jgi:hypothetical protein
VAVRVQQDCDRLVVVAELAGFGDQLALQVPGEESP